MNYQPEKHTLRVLYEMLDILGIIDSEGKYYQNLNNNKKLTQQKIEDILFDIQKTEDAKDRSRLIKDSKKLFNDISKYYRIFGSRAGTKIQKKEKLKNAPDKTKDPGYESILILLLGLLKFKENLHIDFLTQLQSQKDPLGMICFINYAIQEKASVELIYKSDRSGEISHLTGFVPVKFNYRHEHWFLIGWLEKEKIWLQYLFHSIQDIKMEYESGGDDKKINRKIPEFNIEKFYEKSFGQAVLSEKEAVQIHIKVPKEKKAAIERRRKEGSWHEKEDYYIWKVYTYNENEVFEYIFRWNGILKIESPKEVKERFQEKIKNFIE